MKLNNKGMSIIEIVLSFALIMVMVVSMLTIVVNYRNKAQISIEKLEMDTFKNTLTQDIQNDILKFGLKEINEEGECLTITGLNNCINLVFQDGSMKAFGTSKVGINDRNSIENKYLYYDGIKYKLHETLPEVVPEGRNLVDLQTIKVEDNNILKVDSTIFEDGTDVSIYSIDVYISHINFKQDFGIHIVASTEPKSEKSVRLLNEAVVEDNEVKTVIPDFIALTPTSDLGLYRTLNTDSGKPIYYYRGSIENNYVIFADFVWKIIRVNEDGTIRIILTEGINNNKKYYFNPNSNNKKYMYYSNSNVENGAMKILEDWYNDNIAINDYYTNKLASSNNSYFCEQARFALDYVYAENSGADMMTYYDNNTMNFKCSLDGNNKKFANSYIGLITFEEVVYAGGYYYLDSAGSYLHNGNSYWTMSPAGSTGNDAYVWYVQKYAGRLSLAYTSNNFCLRPVINLKADTLVTGTGEHYDAYKVIY